MGEVPWEFRELCRTEDLSDDVKELDPLPFDDWKWQISPASKNADAVVAQIERDALAEKLVGPCLVPDNVFGPDEGKLAQTQHVVPLPATTFVAPALAKFANKVERLQKQAPAHKLAISGILWEFKKSLGGGPKNVEAWDRLQKSCQDVVASALLGA